MKSNSSIDAFLNEKKVFKTELVGARISVDLLEKINRKCQKMKVTKSQVIQAGLKSWLAQGEK